jgi:hypothetical protein
MGRRRASTLRKTLRVAAPVELLTGLRRHTPELTLSACDVEHVTPGVVAWFEREATPHTVRRAVLHGLLEDGLRRPAAFVAYRLTADLPAPMPVRVPLPAAERLPERHRCATASSATGVIVGRIRSDVGSACWTAAARRPFADVGGPVG